MSCCSTRANIYTHEIKALQAKLLTAQAAGQSVVAVVAVDCMLGEEVV